MMRFLICCATISAVSTAHGFSITCETREKEGLYQFHFDGEASGEGKFNVSFTYPFNRYDVAGEQSINVQHKGAECYRTVKRVPETYPLGATFECGKFKIEIERLRETISVNFLQDGPHGPSQWFEKHQCVGLDHLLTAWVFLDGELFVAGLGVLLPAR